MPGFCSLLFCLVPPLAAQPLDWTGDLTLFGSPADEVAPALALAPSSSLIHAFCICADTLVALKRSRDVGLSWSAVSFLNPEMDSPRVTAASDGVFNYALVFSPVASPRRLYRFTQQNAAWDTATVSVAPAHTGHVLAATLCTDHLCQPADPYLNLCWLERDSSSADWTLWFAQSRDHGLSFRPERQLFADDHLPTFPLELALTASWMGETERLLVALPVDRAGSIPEQVRLLSSGDQGETWCDSLILDSTARAQTEPALAALDSVVIVAFTRSALAQQTDIVYSYSMDGGANFAPLITAADHNALREHSPRLALDPGSETFFLFYLADSAGQEAATLWLRSGSLLAPEILGAPVMICECGDAVAAGGLFVAANAQGIASAWVSRFELGDLDVHLDASWRGAGIPSARPVLPADLHFGAAYPNPFNGATTLPLTLADITAITLDIYDLLGRRVFTLSPGTLPPGDYLVPLDLSTLPSGIYWVRIRDIQAPSRRLVLIR